MTEAEFMEIVCEVRNIADPAFLDLPLVNEHRFIHGVIDLSVGDVQRFKSEMVESANRSALARRASPEGAGWGSRAIMLTSSSSRKLRPSKFSTALLAEAGRSRAKLIETFSIADSHY